MRGIVPRAVEEVLSLVGSGQNLNRDEETLQHYGGGDTSPILNLKVDSDMSGNTKIYLRIQVFLIHCEQVYDLLSSPKSIKRCKTHSYLDGETVVSKIVGASDRIILSLEQYYNTLQDCYIARK